ncbi:MAG: radical SAM protein, partial [Anaerolineaceae bacterium]|nr:radical SAM protein [Anaerolineaceae bacterium]
MSLLSELKQRFAFGPVAVDARPVPALYAYLREAPGEKTRIHLRIDPDGRGMLMVNASQVFHLNPTAATMAYLALEEFSEAQAISFLTSKYHLPSNQAHTDYHDFLLQLETLIHPDGACPVCDLELETTLPFSARPSAPYRMDLALTYRCNNNCAHCYNARPRRYPELPTQAWKQILDRLWELRIPHVVFTGGEPTLRDDLPELIAHAEKNGQITGLNTNGRRLSDPRFLDTLVEAGLDHVQITLESHAEAIHDRMVAAKGAWQQTVMGLRNALSSRLYVMTNTTLLDGNSPFLADTLEFLAENGVPTVGLNALIYSGRGLTVGNGLPESALPPLLDVA